MHREALTLKPEERNLNQIVIYRVIQSSIYVISILLITSRNVGFIISSVVGHAVAIYCVFKSHRRDHKHPVTLLIEALKDPDKRADLRRALKPKSKKSRSGLTFGELGSMASMGSQWSGGWSY